ncbi:MAG: SEL1-like repeat protein [Thermoplasmata archaeon]|nr:SEL1-like repeat protein [Thermoplasmata archaeon]
MGFADADALLAYMYLVGAGVEVDESMAAHYFQSAALKGDVYSQ